MAQLAVNRLKNSELVVVGPSNVEDLDRSCRLALLKDATREQNTVDDGILRDVSGSVRSVERAGSLLSSMAQRVRDLSAVADEAKAESAKLKSERDHFAAECDALTSKLAAEIDRSVSHEVSAKKHEGDAKRLAGELSKALSDIDALTAVITATFGPPVKAARSA